MAELLAPLRLVHALTGILLVSGLLGRAVALARAERAARAADLPAVRTLLEASGVFERIVIPSSALVLVLGLLTAWRAEAPLLGTLEGGTANWLLVSLVLYLGTFPLVPLVFLPRGRRFGAALDEATSLGRVTPTLVAAFGDPLTRAAHLYEFVAVGTVLMLMLAKPF